VQRNETSLGSDCCQSNVYDQLRCGERRAVEAMRSERHHAFVVRSGIPGGPTTGGPDSVEFAIAPLLDDHPQYRNAIFVKSDPQGKYEVALPPGRYWVGPRAKALDPENYKPAAVTVSEEVVVVRDGFTELDLVAIGYAP